MTVQSGSESFNIQPSINSNTKNVTFSTPFGDVPNVVCCISDTGPNFDFGYLTCSAMNVTKTGFTIKTNQTQGWLKGHPGGVAEVFWMAVPNGATKQPLTGSSATIFNIEKYEPNEKSDYSEPATFPANFENGGIVYSLSDAGPHSYRGYLSCMSLGISNTGFTEYIKLYDVGGHGRPGVVGGTTNYNYLAIDESSTAISKNVLSGTVPFRIDAYPTTGTWKTQYSFNVNFEKPFDTIPTIVCGMSDAAPGIDQGYLTCMAWGVTKTGFQAFIKIIDVTNDTAFENAGGLTTFSWIAM